MAFYAGVLGLSNDHDKLTDVAGYILAHKLTRITHRDVQMGIKSMRGADKREMEALFDQLDGLGWINLVPGPRSSSPPYGQVNAAVHTKFAARAKAEADRRERDRAIIQELARGAT